MKTIIHPARAVALGFLLMILFSTVLHGDSLQATGSLRHSLRSDIQTHDLVSHALAPVRHGAPRAQLRHFPLL